MQNKDELKKIFKGEIWDSASARKAYSRDASLFEIRPQMVVAPKDAEDIKNIVKYVSQNSSEHLSITPRSGGTDMTGGAIGESIVLDVSKYLNHLKEVGDGYAVTEPGVFYRKFEHETLKRGLLLPSYPASREICTVGGMVANNSGGEKTLAYGKTEDYVQSLRAVLSDGNEYSLGPLTKTELDVKMSQNDFEGEIYRKVYKLIEENFEVIQNAKPKVSKNSSGYALWDVWNKSVFDLSKLFVGSQGTLGIITEISLRLIKPKKKSKLLVIFLRDLKLLPEVTSRILRYKPESFESFDDHTLKLALRYIFTLIKLIKPRNIFSLAWSFLPEAKMVLTGGFPKLIMLAEFTGDTNEEIDEKTKGAAVSLEGINVSAHITQSEQESRKYWVIRRESFNLLRHHLKKGIRTAPFIDDLIVRADDLPTFLPKLNAILDKYDLVYTIAGHVGDGNFHIIPLMNLKDERNRKIIPELAEKVYGLVFEFGGSMSGEHNDGLIRGPFLKQMYGEKIYALFEETKRIFDPQNIFNPGKKVGATIQYAMEHLAKQ